MTKLSFVDEARLTTRKNSRHATCKLGAFLAQVPKSVRDDVEQALAQPRSTVSSMAIGKVLAGRFDVTISDDLISHHRTGKCCCVRS